MKIKRLYINNYKSLVNFELIEPNPFSVFVGPNAAGKSNIFEALEFLSFIDNAFRADELFGGILNYLNKNHYLKNSDDYTKLSLKISLDLDERTQLFGDLRFQKANGSYLLANRLSVLAENIQTAFQEFSNIFSRIFINQHKLVKTPIKSSNKLALDCENLEKVLLRILNNEVKKDEITDWLQMLIPEIRKVDITKSELSSDYHLKVFEKHLIEPIGKNLISDGTYNILALLTAVYQSDEPQFLCIEEPENGLNPYVIRELVGFFRQVCEEKGHYIWLNTHSPTLVKELQPKELILINKVNGVTKAKQLDKDLKFKSMPLDEAWLTNTLGGGLPW